MKKHLIAAAVAAAVATPAMAQVTVYGIIETGLQNFDNGTTAYNRAIDGAVNTSRLGFRGNEDLGNGLKAEFQMEARINPSNGGFGNNTEQFNRELWVGVSGSFGSVRVGRSDITGAVAIAPTDVSGNLADASSKVSIGADRTNVVRYTSPSFSGFQGQVGYATGSNRETGTDASATDMTSVYAQYKAGPLMVHAGMVNGDAATKVAETSLTGYGASYDLGVAKIGFSVNKHDISTAADADYKQTIVAVAVPVGQGLTVHGVYNVAKDLSNDKIKGMAVALNKDFSKRTYATLFYGRQDADTNSETVGSINILAGSAAGTDTNTFGFVVGHKF